MPRSDIGFLEDIDLIAEELKAYRRESLAGEAPVVRQRPIAELVEALGLRAHLEQGTLSGAQLIEFLHRYLEFSTRLHHPGSLAHQVAAPHPTAALAMLIEGATNNPMAIYEMGPAAASIEAFLLDWLNSKVGWTDGAGGVLTHGGSLANLTALAAARGRFDREIWAHGCRGDLALIASADCHYSVARAAGIMGIGEDNIYHPETDIEGRLIPRAIGAAVERARKDSKRPFALVANACSTATGAFDALGEIGRICRDQNLWLHVDGAHGASALLSPRHRGRLEGVELADSLTWDAHKLLCTPALCTAVLVRKAATLDTAFHQDASYLFHDKAQSGFDFIHRTVECTKASLGLRIFLVLGAMGEAGVAEYIDRQFALTRDAYGILRAVPGLECPFEPQSNILCFRAAGTDDDQLCARDALLAEGSFHLSTAVVGGRRYLRAVFTNETTTAEDVRRLAKRVLEITREAHP